MGLKIGDAPHKSTFSGPVGNCVTAHRPREGFVQAGHSTEPGRIVYTESEWQAFIDGVKAGEFDLD